MNIQFKYATSKDVDNIYSIYKDRWNKDAAKRVKYYKSDFRKYVRKKAVFGAYLDGKLVGFMLTFDLINWGYIEILCIKKKYRGLGFGTQMVKYFLSHCPKKWRVIETCYLIDDKKNIEKFLIGCGFIDSNERTNWMYAK